MPNPKPSSKYPNAEAYIQGLIKAFPEKYGQHTVNDYIDMMEKIAKVESQNKNVRQMGGGPGRGYFQVEERTAPVALQRLKNIAKEIKGKGIEVPELTKFNKDFTNLSKDEQMTYAFANMVKAASAKRTPENPNLYINPKQSKDMWLKYHWAGKEKDVEDRTKHWLEIFPEKEQPLTEKKQLLSPVKEKLGLYAQVKSAFNQVAPYIPGAALINKLLPYEQGGPVYNWIPPIYPRVGARNEQGGWLEKYGNGGKVGKYARKGETYNEKRATELGYTPDSTGHLPSVDYETNNWLKSAQHLTAWKEHLYGYLLNPAVSTGYNLGFDFGGYFGKNQLKYYPKKEDGGTIEGQKIPTPTTPSFYPAYPDRTLTNYQMGTPKAPMYAHGATVWTKQTTPTWVAGTPTPTTTQKEIAFNTSLSPGTQVGYPEIKITGPTDPYSPSSNVLKGYNPYKGPMRLHAPDTTMIARNGGYVPMYGFGSTITDIGKLGLNTLAAPLEQVTGNNFVNFDYANKGMANAAAVSEGILGAAADVAGTAFLGPAYGMGKGQLQGITKGIGTSQEYQKGADKWANKTGQIAGSTGDLVAGIASGNPQQIVGGAGNLLGTAGGQLGSKELSTVGQLGSLGSSFINPQSTFSFGKTGTLAGAGDLVSSGSGMMAKHGSYITSKYNPPGLRYQALNPGVSAPAGIYTGPTTQRGITFGNGGNVPPLYVSNPNDPRLKLYNDSLALFKSYGTTINKLKKDLKAEGRSLKHIGVIPFKTSQYVDDYKDDKILPIGFSRDTEAVDFPEYTWSTPIYKKPVQPVIYQPKPDTPRPDTSTRPTYSKVPLMPMRGMPSINIEEAVPQKVNVPKTNPLPPQYMDTRGEWSSTPQVPPVYTPEQLLKMGYRAPQKKKNGGWLDNL